MKLAETVTFGGGTLDRAAELRGTDLDAAARMAGGGTILMWRGKPLVCAGALAPLMRLPLDHPVLGGARRVLLGRREDGTLVFAHDISHWTPADMPGTLDSFADPTEQSHPDLPDAVFAELRRIMVLLDAEEAAEAATARALFGWHDIHGFCARCGAPSEIVQAGWQRTCPSCGAHHFPRTDPVVIMLVTDGNSALLGRSPGWPEGMYSLLAGFVEPGETLEAAVRREVYEETRVPVGEVEYLASQPWPFPASLMIGMRGRALGREITIDPVEIEDAIWVTRENVSDAMAGRHAFLMPAREGAIAQFLLRNWLADRLD
ncbi:NAD(+) diphosphatase [Roseovarius aquimarinus]|uniref:NAD(+) diphosphatase n=1 Tax=Roseovarius aquimarinus TaxID=1229156 RepID=A0ABW7I6W7_9RHOB